MMATIEKIITEEMRKEYGFEEYMATIRISVSRDEEGYHSTLSFRPKEEEIWS